VGVVRTGALVALGLALACTEFPNEPTKTVTVRPSSASWTKEWFVRDSDILAVDVRLPDSTQVAGLSVEWESEQPAIVEVMELPPGTGSPRQDSLTIQLKAKATAHARGRALITVTIRGGGAFEPILFKDTVTVMERWTAVSAGGAMSCGVTIDGNAFCWGQGRLGDGSDLGDSIPVAVLGQITFSAISAGAGHMCGLSGAGIARCWGENRYGSIGNNTQFDQLTPVETLLGQTFKSISAGARYTCGVAQTSTAYCWGFDRANQLGDFAPPAQRPVPDPVLNNCDPLGSRCALTPVPVRSTIDPAQGIPFLKVSAGSGLYTCGLKPDSTAVCWGLVPLLVTGDFFNPPPPCSAGSACFLPVSGGHHFASIATGSEHTCAIEALGGIYCWGKNSVGELGRTGPADTLPRQVIGRLYQQVSTGQQFTCGIATDSIAYCWGRGEFGQLGSGTLPSSTPMRVGSEIKFVQLSAGANHACGVTPKGAAYCWGRNDAGQLGLGETRGPDLCGATPCSQSPIRVRDP